MVRRISVLVLGLCCAFSVFAYAQELDEETSGSGGVEVPDNSAEGSPGGTQFGLGALVGAATMGGITYTQVILTPDLDFGIFGIGLRLNLEFDKDGKFRPGEWDSVQAILSKIDYLRVGHKGDTFYLRFGSLKNATLGHGTIVDRFDNTLYMPDVRLMGFQLDIDFGAVGFETFTSNAFLFDILAARLFFRPFTGLFDKLHIGATYAGDLNTKNMIKTGEGKYEFSNTDGGESVHIIGVDLGLPLPDLGILSWLLYADYSWIVDQGSGFAAGIAGDIAFIFNWKFEFNHNRAHYISSYFDFLYLINRGDKYESLAEINDPYSGWLFRIWKDFSIVAANDLTVSLQIKDSFGDELKPMLSFDLHLDRKLLFDRVEFDLNYTKNNIESFKDVFKIEDIDSFFNVSLGYMVADNVMIALVYSKTFMEDPETPGALKSQSSTMVQTRLVF